MRRERGGRATGQVLTGDAYLMTYSACRLCVPSSCAWIATNRDMGVTDLCPIEAGIQVGKRCKWLI